MGGSMFRARNAAKGSFALIGGNTTPTEAHAVLKQQKRLLGIVTDANGSPLGAANRDQIKRSAGGSGNLIEELDIPQLFLDPDANMVDVIAPINEILDTNPAIPAVVVEDSGVVSGVLSRQYLKRIENRVRLMGLEGSGLGGTPTNPAKMFMCPLKHMYRVYDSTYQGASPRCQKCGRKMIKEA